MDVSGEHQLDVLHSIYKQRLSPQGEPINEKPEEIKLGAEHEGEGEGEDKEKASQEGAKQEAEKEEKKEVANPKDVCGR